VHKSPCDFRSHAPRKSTPQHIRTFVSDNVTALRVRHIKDESTVYACTIVRRFVRDWDCEVALKLRLMLEIHIARSPKSSTALGGPISDRLAPVFRPYRNDNSTTTHLTVQTSESLQESRATFPKSSHPPLDVAAMPEENWAAHGGIQAVSSSLVRFSLVY
jgi:hypothetical protein